MNKQCIDINLNDPDILLKARKGENLTVNWNGEKIIIPKIINGHRKDYQRTESQLKNLKLIPIDPPIGYGLQQFTGDIFYLYDINKTEKCKASEIEKTNLSEYRRELRVRKTCPECKKVQKLLKDVCIRRLTNGANYKSCLECYYKKENIVMEELEQEKARIIREERLIKHDFTSYFIERGINLNEPIKETDFFDTVYLDFETTGLSPEHDEILQVAIIDDKGKVLFYKLCKPQTLENWDEAMKVNNISPEDVKNELPFEAYSEYISSILLRSNNIICYNCPFEIGFLNKYGIQYSEDSSLTKFIDCMIMFAEIYGEFSEYFQKYKCQKLSDAAKHYKYNFENQEHNSLADVFATKFIYEKMLNS